MNGAVPEAITKLKQEPGKDLVQYGVGELTVSVGGDLAFCHSLDVFSARRWGARRLEVRFATTLCMERVGGVWLITAERVDVVE